MLANMLAAWLGDKRALLSIKGQSVKLTVSQPHNTSSLPLAGLQRGKQPRREGRAGRMWPKEETLRDFFQPRGQRVITQ